MHHEHQDSIAHALRALNGRTIIAAVSGGPDSMAMFHGLCTLARERELTVIAAHFDHGLRQDSHGDVEPVQHLADRFGVRVVTGRGDVAPHAWATRQSIEAAARELRYAFLERVADETRADTIATAHTRDDQIETVLMRILRGASARGGRGIHARRGRVVRPMLSVARADTHAYCRAHAVPFVEDPTNADVRFERNRIRHVVLPELRMVYPGIDDCLLRIAENAGAEFRRAEEAATRQLQTHLKLESTNTWVLAMGAFHHLDDLNDRLHLISAALDALNALTDVTEAHHEQVLGLLDTGAGTAHLPGLQVRREHDGLVFTRAAHLDRAMNGLCGGELPNEADAHTLRVPGTIELGGWRVDACRVDTATEQFSNSGNSVAYLACNDTMRVRYPRDGDRMQPFGMQGHKKLSDLFIDRKLPKRRRATTPVVEVNGEIVWVVGVATSEQCRVGAGSRDVVQLTATRSRS